MGPIFTLVTRFAPAMLLVLLFIVIVFGAYILYLRAARAATDVTIAETKDAAEWLESKEKAVESDDQEEHTDT